MKCSYHNFMGLKWSKYILKIKVNMLIVDKNSQFYFIFDEKEEKTWEESQ